MSVPRDGPIHVQYISNELSTLEGLETDNNNKLDVFLTLKLKSLYI